MVALTVGTATLVVLVQQVELVAVLGDDVHHVLGSAVVLLERTLTLLELITALAGLGLIQSSPLVLHHLHDAPVDGELDAVGTVDVVEADVVLVVVVLQDQ